MDVVALSTNRFTLEPPQDRFAHAIARYCRDEEIETWVSATPLDYDLSDAEEFLEIAARGWEEDKPTWFIVIDDEPVGHLSFLNPLDEGQRTGIGFLMDRGARNRGIMTEAVRAACEFAFLKGVAAIGWSCIILDGKVNWASAKVAWKAGFTCDGVIRKSYLHRGQLVDTLVATLLPGEPMEPATPWLGPDRGRPAIPSPRDPEALVKQFHHTYRMPIRTDEPSLRYDRLGMRMALISEEFIELVGAVYGQEAAGRVQAAIAEAPTLDDGTRDIVEAADALADLTYVIYGMALESGISLPDVLAEVQASNLSKLGEDGQPIYREDGKVLKGPNFFHPDIARVLDTARVTDQPSAAHKPW